MPKDMVKYLGPVTRTLGGKEFDILNPQIDMFDVNDLHHAQSQWPRFMGGMVSFYSCAQHVVIGTYLAEDIYGMDVARAYLSRFTPRYYMGNLNRSLMELFPDLQEIERKIGRKALEAFDMDPNLWMGPQMKRIDAILTACEYRDLKPYSEAPMLLPEPDPNIIINPLTPAEAYVQLNERCLNDLFPEADGVVHIDHVHETPERTLQLERSSICPS